LAVIVRKEDVAGRGGFCRALLLMSPCVCGGGASASSLSWLLSSRPTLCLQARRLGERHRVATPGGTEVLANRPILIVNLGVSSAAVEGEAE